MLYMIRIGILVIAIIWRHNTINWHQYITNWQLKCESQIANKRHPGISLILLLGWVVGAQHWVVLRVSGDTFTYGLL